MLIAEMKKNDPPQVYWMIAGIRKPPEVAESSKNTVPTKYYIPPSPANKSTQNPVGSLAMFTKQGLFS